MPNPTIRAKATTGELVQPGDVSNNAVRVNIVAGAGSGGTAATDDSAFTPGGTSITPVGGTYRSVLDSVDDNDTGAFAMTQTRSLFVNVRDDAGDSAMDGANNALRVNIVAGAGSGGTAMTDEAAFTEGGTSFTPVGGVLNDTIVSDPTEDQAATFRITAKRGLHVNLRDVGGTEVGTAGAPVRVDPTGSTTQPVSNTVLSVVGGGTEAAAQRVTIANDSTGVLSVDDNGASLTIDGTVAVTQATASSLNAEVQGDAAHDAPVSGNPVRLGARAESSLETVTTVADGDTTDLYADLDGVLITKQYTTFGELISERVTNTDGASTALATFGAGGASVRNYVTAITITNTSSTSTFVDIRDGIAGAVLWTFPAPANGGATMPFNPPLRQPTVNTALAYDPGTAVTTMYLSFNGFQSVL